VPEVHAAVEGAGEMKGKVIATHSKKGAKPFCGLCEQVMSTFASAYGSEAGVAALKWIPLGGLYIAGGLTPKNLELLRGEKTAFMQAFYDKGRVSPLLKRVPMYAVLAEDIGQRGAHLVAFRLLIAAQEEAELAAPKTLLPVDASEFDAVKHSLPWKGSYQRKLVISPTEIITKDPASGTITNRWPKDAVAAATAIEEDDEKAARFVIRLLSGGLFCGMGGTDLTFSASDKAERSTILQALEALS